ncbi:hypothetical protein DsansV1_C05g0052181 [Dioscorea sansibarensis]
MPLPSPLARDEAAAWRSSLVAMARLERLSAKPRCPPRTLVSAVQEDQGLFSLFRESILLWQRKCEVHRPEGIFASKAAICCYACWVVLFESTNITPILKSKS